MNTTIIPAILEQRFATIEHKMKRVAGRVALVQVDICDGDFVPTTTYACTARQASLEKIVSRAAYHKLALELDIMVNLDKPKVMTRWAEGLGAVRPKGVVFHLGSTYRWDELFTRIQQCLQTTELPFDCGLAIRVSHTRREVRKLLEAHPEFSYIQIMGIRKIGYSGQKLDPEIYAYIRKIARAFPDYPIQIDGGVKMNVADSLLEAGAQRLGMNSGLFKSPDFEYILTRDYGSGK